MHALIVCGGTPPAKKLLLEEIENADLTIGADSGGYAFLGFGLRPDLIIGDMDSFKYTNHEGIKVLQDNDQETNDLEKALDYVLGQGAVSCTVLGTVGKRFDHTVKNISVLKRYHDRFNTLIFRDNYGDVFVADSPFKPKLDIGTVISFFPIGGPVNGFSSSGVKYPLSKASLEMGIQDGTSNEITDKNALIEFEEGCLGVFVGTGHKMDHVKRD